MPIFDQSESMMFAKWHGTDDLQNNEEFWTDCWEFYLDKTVKLPIVMSDRVVETISSRIVCPPHACNDCCTTYEKLRMTKEEAEVMSIIGNPDLKYEIKGDDVILDISGGCPFLKDGACSAYDKRPPTCRLFPILSPCPTRRSDMSVFDQLQMRIKCDTSFECIKAIIKDACDHFDLLLLPDLTLLHKDGSFVVDLLEL